MVTRHNRTTFFKAEKPSQSHKEGTHKNIPQVAKLEHRQRSYRNLSGSCFPPPHLHTFILCANLKDSFSLFPQELLCWQIEETKFLLSILERKCHDQYNGTCAFSSDPTVLMWQHYSEYLKWYFNLALICASPSPYPTISFAIINTELFRFPPFISDSKLHNSHREYFEDIKLASLGIKESNYKLELYFPPVIERLW